MTSGQPQPLLAGVLAALSLNHGSTRFARVGIDVVSVAWFARQLASHPAGAAPIELSSFTSAERTYCAGRPERYAARWAAKEAVAKAIGTGFRGGLRPANIEIHHHPEGQPVVSPADGSTWPEAAHRWRWSLSLCHEEDAAIAIAVALLAE